MLKGCDISKWQNEVPKNFDFVIMRATYGANIDSKFKQHLKNCDNELVGAYCYARTNKDWLQCAKTFIDVVKDDSRFGKSMILALDIEGADATRKNSIEWCVNWLMYVFRETGIKPIVYIQSSLTNKFKQLSDLDFGLWVAHWNVKKPSFKGWNIWTMWQYSDSKGKLDLDFFNGKKEQFLRYCIPKK